MMSCTETIINFIKENRNRDKFKSRGKFSCRTYTNGDFEIWHSSLTICKRQDGNLNFYTYNLNKAQDKASNEIKYMLQNC